MDIKTTEESIPEELMIHLRNLISERKQKGHGTSNIILGARIGYNWANLHSLPPSPVGEAGLKWVKASERKPVVFAEEVIVRSLVTGRVRKTQNMGHNTGWDIGLDWHYKWENTEWLDESPNPSRAGETKFFCAKIEGKECYSQCYKCTENSRAGEISPDQKDIAKWCEKAFGPVDNPNSVLSRANKEMSELLMEAATGNNSDRKIEECADVVICLYRAVDLFGGDLHSAVIAKMEKNKSRKWNTDGFGHGQHIPLNPDPDPEVKEEGESLAEQIAVLRKENERLTAYAVEVDKKFSELYEMFENPE